jgi:hypothetical protein
MSVCIRLNKSIKDFIGQPRVEIIEKLLSAIDVPNRNCMVKRSGQNLIASRVETN